MQYLNKIIKIALVLLLIFGIGQPLVTLAQTLEPRSTVSAVGTTKSNPIKVLKIMPGEFSRNRYDDHIITELTGVSEVKKIGDSYIQIERITMPEFIGKTTKLNGYYDVIQIDNQFDGLVDIGEWDNSKAQRSYSQINDESGNECGTAQCTIDPSTQLLTGWPTVSMNYNENDITKRKAEELIEFAQGGQLIYYDTSINNIERKDSLLATVLYTGLTNKTNAKFYESKKLTQDDLKVSKPIINENDQLKMIVTDFKAITNKRIPFTVTKSEATGNIATFELTTNQIDQNAEVKLFLDLDGDGVFREDELMTTETLSQTTMKITTAFKEDFLGKLPWKIEIEKVGVASYQTGEFIIKPTTSTTELKKLKVLQLTDGSDSENQLLWKHLTESRKKTLATAGYQLEITTKKVRKIDGNDGNVKELANPDFNFNDYNYIIIGLSSSNGWDNSEAASNPEMKIIMEKLVAYTQAGGGILFTSRTMTTVGNNRFNQLLTQNFRSILGQARFEDFTRSETAVAGNSGEDAKYDFSGDLIPYQSLNHKKIYGFSRYASNMMYPSSAYQTNVAPIANYPFSPEKIESNGVPSGMYQLNLEDDKVVPLYNMAAPGNEGQIYQYDTRNSYSMYKRENVSFLLIGGQTFEISESYFELLLNLIVSADRLPKPTLQVTGVPDEILAGSDWKIPFQAVATVPTTQENKKLNLAIELKRGTESLDNRKIETQSEEIKDITISGTKSLTAGQTLTLTVVATDSTGRKSNVYTKNIKVVNYGFQEQLAGDKGYLAGDKITVNRTVVKMNIPTSGNSGRLCNFSGVVKVNGTQYWSKNDTSNIEFTNLNLPKIINEIKIDAFTLQNQNSGIIKVENTTTIKTGQGNCNANSLNTYTASSSMFIDLRVATITTEFIDENNNQLTAPYKVTIADVTQTNTVGHLNYVVKKTGEYIPSLIIPQEAPLQSLVTTEVIDKNGSITTLPKLSYDNNDVKVKYTFGEKQVEPVFGEIQIGLENNQFQLGTNTPTLATNSYATIGSSFTLVDQPQQFIIDAPNKVEKPVLYYKTAVGYSPVPGITWVYDDGKKQWLGSVGASWNTPQAIISWLPPTAENKVDFLLRWSVKVEAAPTKTKVTITPDPTGKNSQTMEIKVYSDIDNLGSPILPDLF